MMHFRGRLVVWLALLMVAFSAHPQWVAAEPPLQMNPGLANQLRYFQLAVVSGRIAINSPHSGRRMEAKHRDANRQESLTLTLAAAYSAIHYELSMPESQLTIEINGDGVAIRRQVGTQASQLPLDFDQPASGPLTLAVGPEEDRRVFRAATLWHLFLAEPDLCRNELAPLLQLLRPDWSLAETATRIEEALLRSAEARRTPDRDAWLSLVQDLSDPKYSRRQAAARKLRNYGSEILPFLTTLDRRKLDAEQWYRVRTLIASLAGGNEYDVPERTAPWLAGDPRVWHWLIARDEASKRKLAAEQLGRLLGGRLEYDPAAEPEVRQAQWERLKERVEQAAAPIDPTVDPDRPAP